MTARKKPTEEREAPPRARMSDAEREQQREIFRANYKPVCGALRRRGVPVEAMEDVAHDVFIALFDASHDGTPETPETVTAKLMRLARGKASNYRNREARSPVTLGMPSSRSEKPTSNRDADGPLEREKRARRFRYALSQAHRDVVDAIVIDRMSHQDAADELGLARTTVSSRLEAAMRALDEMEEAFRSESERGRS